MWQLGQRCSPKSPTLQLLSMLVLLPPLRWHNRYCLNFGWVPLCQPVPNWPWANNQKWKYILSLLCTDQSSSTQPQLEVTGSPHSGKEHPWRLGRHQASRRTTKHISNGSPPHGSWCTKTTVPATRPDIATTVGSLRGSWVSWLNICVKMCVMIFVLASHESENSTNVRTIESCKSQLVSLARVS